MWLSCSVKSIGVESKLLQESAKASSKGAGGFVRDLLLTAGSAPHLVLMDPTYVVIAMPTSCQLRCRRAFVHQRDATVLGFDPSPSATSRHLRGATQIKSLASSLRSFDLGSPDGGGNIHRHLIAKGEYIVRGDPCPGQIKAFLLELDRPHIRNLLPAAHQLTAED